VGGRPLGALARTHELSQHRGVAARQVAGAKATHAVLGLALSVLGCDASVTSVGAWAPIQEQPEPPSRSLYLEAESGELSGGFATFSAAAASNGQYLEASAGTPPSDDDAGPARSLYHFNVPAAGDYIIWGRIWSPGIASNRFWFQVDDTGWHLWRISVGTIWFWDDLHEQTDYHRPLIFPLAPGAHRLVIASAVTGAKLDRLYITAEGDEPPGNDTLCYPPHSIDLDGECHDSCGSHANVNNMSSCLASICQGREVVEAYDCDTCCLVPSP
jgi:hypothetical protein